MRIAQIAPLYESCPPKLYGGTERVVSWLTEELVARGHEVTLFASGDSVTSARLVPGCVRALRLDPSCRDPLAHHIVMLHQVVGLAAGFDILHFHIDYLHYPLVANSGLPTLTTLHGRQDLPELAQIYHAFDRVPVVSISNAQRTPIPWANWRATVPHGLPPGLFRPGPGDGGYLAFIGRVSPEKRLDRAIAIAREVGMPLKAAAKVDRADAEYFATVIKPLLDEPGVEFIHEIGDREKRDFLGRAAALLFPIDWPEPFGLVMIEAMACGTPVLAFPCGAVPEVLEPGVTGEIVTSIEEAVAAVPRLLTLDRARIRARFEARFTAGRMADDYLALYEQLTGTARRPASRVVPAISRPAAASEPATVLNTPA